MPVTPIGTPLSSATLVQYPAGEVLTGNSAVKLVGGSLFLAGYSDDPLSVIGMVGAAYQIGNLASVTANGNLNGFGGLANGQYYYLGIFGQITPTTPPSGAWVRIMGIAQSSSVLFVTSHYPATKKA